MSERKIFMSEVSDEEANQYRRDPARRVAAPGMALIIIGCFGIIINFALAMTLITLLKDRDSTKKTIAVENESYERGRAAAPFVDLCITAIPTLAVYPLVILAGLRMRKLQNRTLSFVGASFAMAPCSPMMLVGLPIGIWSIWVLSNPDVQAAFNKRQRK